MSSQITIAHAPWVCTSPGRGIAPAPWAACLSGRENICVRAGKVGACGKGLRAGTDLARVGETSARAGETYVRVGKALGVREGFVSKEPENVPSCLCFAEIKQQGSANSGPHGSGQSNAKIRYFKNNN